MAQPCDHSSIVAFINHLDSPQITTVLFGYGPKGMMGNTFLHPPIPEARVGSLLVAFPAKRDKNEKKKNTQKRANETEQMAKGCLPRQMQGTKFPVMKSNGH